VYVPGLLYVRSEDKGTFAPDWKDQIVKVISREGPKEYDQSVVLDFYRGSLISGDSELSHEYCFQTSASSYLVFPLTFGNIDQGYLLKSRAYDWFPQAQWIPIAPIRLNRPTAVFCTDYIFFIGQLNCLRYSLKHSKWDHLYHTPKEFA
jgi:hypothetical protein